MDGNPWVLQGRGGGAGWRSYESDITRFNSMTGDSNMSYTLFWGCLLFIETCLSLLTPWARRATALVGDSGSHGVRQRSEGARRDEIAITH